jgi:predicted ATPase/DNA-binding SARP family transcriptional activator
MKPECRVIMSPKSEAGIQTFRLTTLGRFALSVDGVSVPSPATRKARALMAFLLMHRDADTARDALLEIFWPDADPGHARDNLSTLLSSIRRCLRAAALPAEELIFADNSVVRWTADTLVDAQQFATVVDQDDAAADVEGLQLYRGDFLEGDYDQWSTAQRERLATLYETLLARAVRISRDPEAARRLIARNPYAEEGYVVLLETELHAGRSASAVSLVDQYRKALAEIGEKPSAAFEERFGYIGRRSVEVPATNLPHQATSFVGREVELREVRTLIATAQLVTIVGAGGVGKTRVAVHAAAELVHGFDDGVWFADLATMAGEDAVVTEIASAFNVKSSGFSGLLEHVVAHLKHKRLLLVLDNCEHVVAEAARVVDAIVEGCPRVTILATSRERLGSHGEQVYRLPSLAVPPPREKPEADDALKFSAVALFLARASASDAHFAVTDANVGAVVEICRHLDGIALAIELAAARVTALNVHQLLERLRKEFRLLKGDDHKVHPRYQTMRATLDWSYEWLSEAEKALFRRLGIFRGGWTLESIRAAGMDEALDEFAVLDQLWPLVNKSLVAVEFRAQSQRYRLMEPLRQYALELLKEHGELDATAQHHARYFTEFGRHAGSKWLQVSELTFLANIEEEIDNIRAALEWALSQGHDPALGAELVAHLGPFWFTQYFHEGLRWLEAAQAAVSYETHPALSVQIALGRVRAYMQTNVKEELRAAEEALSPARAVGNKWHLLRLLFLYGVALTGVNRLDEAELAITESLELAERVGDRYRVAVNLWILARLNRKRGNLDAARTLSIRMIEAHDELQLPSDRNRWGLLAERARAELLDGHLARAIELCREGYAVTQATKDPLGGVQAEYYLGVFLLMSGAVEEARTRGRSVLRVSREELFPHGIPPAIQLLGGVATQCEQYEQAARLIGFAEAKFPEQTLPRDMYVDVEPEWFLGPLRDRFGEARLAELMADGAAWLEGRAIEEALNV